MRRRRHLDKGHLAVVSIRAQTLIDFLRTFLDPGNRPGASGHIELADLDWQAQRLESAATKALGTRDR